MTQAIASSRYVAKHLLVQIQNLKVGIFRGSHLDLVANSCWASVVDQEETSGLVKMAFTRRLLSLSSVS